MDSFSLPFTGPAAVRLPYQQATGGQRAQASSYVQHRLQHHFPTLRPGSWAPTLAEFRPDLWLTGSTVTLAEVELTQLVQHLAAAPEVPVLDPPIYGLPALQLAQHSLHTSELASRVLPELAAANEVCGPRLFALLCRLTRPSVLAQRVVDAWCWNLASAPPLPSGIPGGGPGPGSSEVEQWLAQLNPAGGACSCSSSGAKLPQQAG